MGTKRTIFSIGHTGRVLLAATFSVAAVAQAQAFQVSAEARAACTPDAMRLCSSEIPNISRVTACMHAHQSQLSGRCQAAMAGAGASHGPAVREASNHGSSSHGSRHHHGYSGTHYASHSHRGGHGWGGSGQGMQIAKQLMAGYGMACASGSVPAEYCNMGAGGMGGMGGMGNMGGMSDMIAQFMQ